jgi:hypothetical protein
MRSLLSILLIGVPVTLILSLVGLSHGMLEIRNAPAASAPTSSSGRPASLLTLSSAHVPGLVDYLQGCLT